MADYCQQCSLEIFGEDFKELAGITTAENEHDKEYAVVLCEGCGPIQVDNDGVCLSVDCSKKHGLHK